jgi:D-apionolactonase
VTSAANLLLYGSTNPLPERAALSAGPFTLAFEAGDLRYVSIGDREVVRRVYGAVRDRDWRTVPGRITDLRIVDRRSGFDITYRSEHVSGAIDFVWNARIQGDADGTIVFDFAGLARSTFHRNRIGLCVLHPIRECAGRRARVTTVSGAVMEAVFPTLVAIEQPVSGFSSIRGLEYDVELGSSVAFELEGETFETEDQRNWIDASFKTYSTPLSLPRPVEVPKGTRIAQRVTVRLKGSPGSSAVSVSPSNLPARIELAGTAPTRIPKIGIGVNDVDLADAAIVQSMKSLGAAHFRVDLDLASNWRPVLRDALALHRATGSEIELALHLPDGSEQTLETLAQDIPHPHGIVRLLVFSSDRLVTRPEAMAAASKLGKARPDLPQAGAGSRADLYELHLTPPPTAPVVCWSMNPHAHASDVTSLAETPPAGGEQVVSLLARHADAAVVISPVTLEPREAADDDEPLLTLSVFGAAWVLAIASQLTHAGVDAITFFDRGSCLAAATVRNAPVLRVLAALCGAAGGTVVPLSYPDTVGALLVRSGTRATLLLANLSREPRRVSVPAEFRPVTVQNLSSSSPEVPAAAANALMLDPFGSIRVDGVVSSPT